MKASDTQTTTPCEFHSCAIWQCPDFFMLHRGPSEKGMCRNPDILSVSSDINRDFCNFLEFPPFPGKVPVVVHKIFVGMPNGHVFVNDSASASLSASEKLNKSGIESGDSGIAKN